MKCTKCGTDNKLKERAASGGRCKSCRHPFVFDPKGEPEVNFTDRFFANMLAGLSVNDSLFFTPRQLYFFLNARKPQPFGGLGQMGCGLIVLAVIGFLVINSLQYAPLFILLISVPLLVAGILLLIPGVRKRLRARRPKEVTVAPNQFQQWIDRWAKVNGPIAKMLPPPARAAERAEISPEVKAYSFDRAVICGRATVAQFLIANNFHFENNCAVLAIGGYPQSIFETVMEMLRRNPELKVYCLHDASPRGVHLAHRLRTDPKWFQGSQVMIFDLGLLPRQVMNRSFFIQQSAESAEQAAKVMAAAVRATLQPEEVKWLEEGNYVELESLSPQLLLRLITLGIAQSRDPRASDALVAVDSGGADGGVYVFSADSFG